MSTLLEDLKKLPVVRLRIINISNPYCWYRDKLGEEFEGVWFNMWGCYIIKERCGMHPDDIKLRDLDVIIVTSKCDNCGESTQRFTPDSTLICADIPGKEWMFRWGHECTCGVIRAKNKTT